MKEHQQNYKLMIFTDSMSLGGAERVTAHLANHWATKGWEITLVTLAPKSMDSYDLNPAVNRISLELTGNSGNALVGLWQNVRRITALRRILRQTKPKIALGMMDIPNVLLALAAWGLPVCTVGSVRNHPPEQKLGLIWENLRFYAYYLLSVVSTQTKESQNWIRLNTKAKSISVIPNPVFWPLTEKEPQIIPNPLYRHERHMLLTVGRLHPQKGFDNLIKVFSKLADKHPNWDLAILGEGELRSDFEKNVLELGLKNRIFLHGRVGNVSKWYETAELFVLSSRYEGFPNVLTEAMAYGLPAVSFDCDTGPRDIIRHEIDGLLVNQGDLMGLADALHRLMSDDALRKQYAEKATEVRERFSMPKIIAMWEQLFSELL